MSRPLRGLKQKKNRNIKKTNRAFLLKFGTKIANNYFGNRAFRILQYCQLHVRLAYMPPIVPHRYMCNSEDKMTHESD